MISIKGKTLKCSHCGGEDFKKSEAQLNTTFLTFLDLDWLNRTANVFICHACGKLEWFLQPSIDRPDEKPEPTTCVACGSTILSGEDTCSNCGWSYK